MEASENSGSERRLGGYDYEFVDEVSDSLKCPVCLYPMKDAVQTTECGHRLCNDCLHGILRSDHPVCPIDRREIQREGGFYLDKAWTRDNILSLRVKCKQNAKGCDWIGPVRHAEEHKDECPCEDEECLGCCAKIQRQLLENHLNEDCPERIIECEHCHDDYMFFQKKEHEDIYCRRFPLVCENNCGKEGIPRDEMESHVIEECPLTEVKCPYYAAGCRFQDKRCLFNEHMEASIDDHLLQTWSSQLATKQELNDMKEANQKQTKSLADHQKQIQNLEEANQNLTKSVADHQKQIKNLARAFNAQQQRQAEEREKVERTLNTLQASILGLSSLMARNVSATPRCEDVEESSEGGKKVLLEPSQGEEDDWGEEEDDWGEEEGDWGEEEDDWGEEEDDWGVKEWTEEQNIAWGEWGDLN